MLFFPVSLSNSILSGNTAGDLGGGIFSSESVTVNNCTISGNSSGDAGGGIYDNQGILTISNSTISDNSASGYEGHRRRHFQ